MKDLLSLIKNYFFYFLWILKGRHDPPHSLFKRKRLKKLSKKFNCKILIETGTADGKTLKYLHRFFENLIQLRYINQII